MEPCRTTTAAKVWYAGVLGAAPCFDQPFYVGFAVGGFELGLVPDGAPGATGATAYWGVTDAAAELARLASLDAVPHEALQDVGGGIRVATLLDPDGNRLGIIEKPHFDPGAVR
ncbi:MAG: VOC family protein [Burkholderiaceae bacterium]|nr:VOC family protein [Burkholderiaceae bacterium]